MNSFQPKGYYPLFTIFALERMFYYGVRTLLVLFMVHFLLFNTEKAGLVYGWFLALVMFPPLLGGFIIDMWLGQRKGLILSIIVSIIGCCFLIASSIAHSPFLLYTALALIAVGAMLYKPSVYVLLGNLYDDANDARRDSGFILTILAINIGAFFAPLICGTLGERFGWSIGFLSAGIFMLIALYLLRHVPSEIKKTTFKVNAKSLSLIVLLFFLAVIIPYKTGSAALDYAEGHLSDAPMFWTWMSTTYTIPASWISALLSFPTFLFCIVFAWLWIKLAKTNKNPTTINKFILGLVLLLIGVAMVGSLSVGEIKLPNIVVASLFLAMAEMCITPIFLSLLTKIAPQKWASTFVGGYYALIAATFFTSYIASAYYPYGLWLFLISVFVAIVALVLFRNKFNQWMNGVL
ncbi:MAG: MFS transporter [bacterium]